MDKDEATKTLAVVAGLIYIGDAAAGRQEPTLDEYLTLAGRVLRRAQDFEFWDSTGE